MTRFLLVALLVALASFLALSIPDETTEPAASVKATATTILSDNAAPSLPDNFPSFVDGVRRAAQKPKPATRARTAPRAQQAARAGVTYPTDVLLHDLALCETGGTMDQRATSKTNPPYLSYFQWELSTWHKAGGSGDPRDHSYAEQVPIVRAWILRTGWHSQFPRCSNVIGVSG